MVWISASESSGTIVSNLVSSAMMKSITASESSRRSRTMLVSAPIVLLTSAGMASSERTTSWIRVMISA